jgi:hypothetical protein
MSVDSFEVHQKAILQCIRQAVSKTDVDVFDALDELFNTYFHRSVNNMLDLRKRNAKNKGECFEVFCTLYLRSRGYTVWMLRDLPEDLIQQLSLTRQDVGIDLVAKVDHRHIGKTQSVCQTSKKGEPQTLYFAVQCKYRSPSRDYQGRTVHKVN